jgi:hypothetical protein
MAGLLAAAAVTTAPLAATISVDADVALSALRDTPGRDGAMLGVPTFLDRLR